MAWSLLRQAVLGCQEGTEATDLVRVMRIAIRKAQQIGNRERGRGRKRRRLVALTESSSSSFRLRWITTRSRLGTFLMP